MRILVTGGTGQLGRALTKLERENLEIIPAASSRLDVTNWHQVVSVLSELRPELVVHAGAMTDVDGCQRDPERAHLVNAIGTQHLAAATFQNSIPIVYVSTNFVFDGQHTRPYLEYDTANPLSVYGETKLAGERAVAALNPEHFIVRTAMVFDETGHNFVNTMLRLAETQSKLTVVADQYGNPTYAADLAVALLDLISTRAFGTFHLTNSGAASWHEWACAIFDTAGSPIEVEPIPASSFPRAATPPANGVLANQAAAAMGIELPDWRDALVRCLSSRNQ